MLLLALSTAIAGPTSPGLIVPSATPVDAGRVEASVGGAAGWVIGIAPVVGGGADVRVGFAPVDDLWVSGSATALSLDTATFLGAGSSSSSALYSLSAGWTLVKGPRFWSGPVVSAGVTSDGVAMPMVGWSAGGSLGPRNQLVFDAAVVGGPAFDPSLPVSPVFLGVAEAGLRFWAASPNQVRLGVVSPVVTDGDTVIPLPLPDLTYRHDQARWYLELGATGVPVLAQTLRVELGVKF